MQPDLQHQVYTHQSWAWRRRMQTKVLRRMLSLDQGRCL